MKVLTILVTGAVLALAACARQESPKPVAAETAPASPPVVTVNGKPLSQKLFETYAEHLARRPFAELSPEDREQIRENLVRIELFAQDAEKTGLVREPDVAAALEIARLQVIQQAMARKVANAGTPTDAELRAEYDNLLATMPMIEYHARHIVVSGEDVALKIIDRLKAGQDFATLAKQLSTFKQTARNGGDLGWFPPNALDDELAQAIGLLKKGEIAPRPVQTRMGWHVIQLLGTRDRTPPAFDAIKEQLNQRVLANRLTKASDELLKVATVDPPVAADPASGDAAAAGTTPAPAAPDTPAPAPSPAPPPAN